MFSKLRLYISPFFLSRYYLKKDISETLNKYKFEGKFIDVGCGSKPYRNLFSKVKEYQGIDFPNFSINKDFEVNQPDYFFSKNYSIDFRLPFKTNQFDNGGAFQVLEHVKNPSKFLKEMFRIVKPGGYIIITVPFLGGIHEEPNDFQRLTKYGLLELFRSDGKILEVKEQGSLFSTISMLLNEYLNNFAAKNKFQYILGMLIYPPFLIFSYVSIFLDKIFKSDKINFNYLVLVRKNQNV